MGFLGSERGLTPHLDALAKQSVVFTHAYSQAPLTPASHATILTGTYPQFHQVLDFQMSLSKDLPYAPDILRAHGYHTAAFIGAVALNQYMGVPGIERGFDTYDADFHYEGPGQDRYHTTERRGGEVVARALAWLAKHPKGPFFVWVHLYDPHDPYDPPEPYKTRYAAQPYDGEIAYTDSVVGRLVAQLQARGLFDHTAIAVMADHGESLGAHGEETHGIFLYDDTINVPLLVKLPHQASAGRRIENKVELVDVLPTILDTVDIPTPTQVQGHSLLPLMGPPGTQTDAALESWRTRGAYSQADYSRLAFGWSSLQSLRSGKYLYVQAPRRELYDQAADPKAEHDLAKQSSAVADTLAGQIQALQQKTKSAQAAPQVKVDPSAQAKLASLGYVASENVVVPGSSEIGADPKDKIDVANLLHRGITMRESGHFREAADAFEQVIAKDPDHRLTYKKLGECLLALEEYDKAVPILRKAVQLDPQSPMARFNLARGLMGSGDFAGAISELEFTIAKLPTFPEAHVHLEMAYARTNQIPETIQECKTVLKYIPDHYGSYLILGRFLEMSGDMEGAVPNLKKAISLQPKSPEPHIILADVYDHLGFNAAAERERVLGDKLSGNASQ